MSQLPKLGTRLLAHWQIKLFGITGFITVFFVVYFALLRFPVFPTTLMPVTWLDRAVPFHPIALTVYFSLWLYVSLPPSLAWSRQQLIAQGLTATIMGLVGFVIFFFWPTAAPAAAALDPADVQALAWLKQVDAAGNACPSLHVAFAVHGAIWLDRVLREMRLHVALQLVNVVWCIAITYSTLATKQHVLVDVVAGALLGAVAGFCGTRSSRAPVLTPYAVK
ncbi:MAG: phosphatase PAP2 family protein [Opitutus sp.]